MSFHISHFYKTFFPLFADYHMSKSEYENELIVIAAVCITIFFFWPKGKTIMIYEWAMLSCCWYLHKLVVLCT